MSEPQPGGRGPAPGDLALLQAFLNTFYALTGDHGADLLATSAALRHWLLDRSLLPNRTKVSEADVKRVLVVRQVLRDLIAARDLGSADRSRRQAFDRTISGACVEPRLTAHGLALTPAGRSGMDRALGTLVGIAVQAQMNGSWARLKACPGRHCGWVFYDHSRNNSGRWCSMRVCGAREKARAYYRRQRD